MKTKNRKPLPKKAKSNPATSTSEDASDKLQLAFLSTDLMQDWMEFNDALEAAIKAGKDRGELPLAFLKRVQYEISGTPHRFDAVTEEGSTARTDKTSRSSMSARRAIKGGPFDIAAHIAASHIHEGTSRDRPVRNSI